MERCQFIQYKGKQILYLDFSNLKPEEMIELMKKTKPVFKAQPMNSVLVLDNLNNIRFNSDVMNALADYMQHNKPYVRAAAVFGAGELAKVFLASGERASNRSLHIFETDTQAKDWLISQA